MTTWLEQFEAKLNNLVASRGAVQSTDAAQTAINYIRGMNSLYSTGYADHAKTVKSGSQSGGGIGGALKGGLNGLSWLTDKAERPLYGVASMAKQNFKDAHINWDEDAKNPLKGLTDVLKPEYEAIRHPGNSAKAFGRGFTKSEGKADTWSDVLKQEGAGTKTAAIAGFAADVISDPLNFVAPVKAYKATRDGIKAGKDLLKPGDKIVADVASTGTSKVPVGSTDAKTFLQHLQDTHEPVDSPFTIAETPLARVTEESADDFAVPPAAREATAIPKPSAKIVANKAMLGSIHDEISKVPNLKYAPNTKIAPAYKEIMTDLPAVTAKPATVKAAAKITGMSSTAARVQAMYQHLITNPENTRITVKMGGNETLVTVKQLQALAKAKPEQADMVKQLVVNRASELAKMSKAQLAKLYPEGLKVAFSGRSGIKIPDSGIDVDALEHLFRTGNVPKTALGHGTTDVTTNPEELAVAKHAIHDVSDLPNLSLRRITGEHVSVADLLTELGVKVNPVKTNVESLMESIGSKGAETKPASKSVFSFAQEGEKATPAQVKKVVGLSAAEKKAWIKAHPHLDPADAQALLAVKSVTAFKAKVAELLAAKSDKGFNSVDDLIAAVGEGRVSKVDLDKLFKVAGVKTVAALKTKLNKMVKSLADAEKSTVSREHVISPQDMAASASERAAAKVVPAEQIVANVAEHGTDPVLTSSKEVLDPTQAALLKESLSHGVAKNFISPASRAKYPFMTNKGVHRTMGTYGKGLARHRQSWNAGAQLDAFRSIVNKGVSDKVAAAIEASGAVVKGTSGVFARGTAMYDFVMPILRAQEKILKNEGIPPILGTGATGPLLSTLDVLDSLPKDFVIHTLFNATPGSRQILFTQFNEIAEEIFNHGMGRIDEPTMREQIAAILTNPIKVYDKTKPAFYSNFAKQFQKLGVKNPQSAADMLKQAVDMFSDAMPDIMQRYNNNIATYGLKFGENVPKISNEVINRVSKMLVDPHYSPGDIVEVSTKLNALGASVAKEFGITDEWTIQAGAQTAETKLADILPPEVQAEAKAANEFTRAMDNEVAARTAKGIPLDQRVAKVAAKQSASDSTAVDAIMDAEDINDLGAIVEASFAYRHLRAFAPHIGNEALHPLLIEQVNAKQMVATSTANALNGISKQFDADTLKAAWHEIQGATIPDNPAIREAFDAFKPIVDSIFDGNTKTNFFMRNGVTMRDINAKLAKYHIHPKYAMDSPQSWREFDTTDPLDLISKFHAAAQAALTERTIGARISEKFGSVTAQPGFVRVTGTKSRVAHIIDTERYYPREIAEQFSTLDKALKQFNEPNKTNDFLKAYDGTLHALKAGLTIYRPGHHIRNMVGDMWFSWMAGVNSPVVYRDALKIMAANRGRYKDFDAIRSLQELGVEPGKVGEGAINTKIGGKRVSLTHQDVYRLATQHGIITDYHTIEDISDTGVHAFLHKYSPLAVVGQRGKLHSAAVNVSEGREHYVRLAHFVDVLKKGNFKTITDAGEEGGRVVRKWHPDGSDLGTAEKAVARRAFLFYSWMRKAIPLVIESAVHNPAKVLAYPKAYYAIAQSMGVDLNGFGDPYPTDQLFPEWIRDNVEGPITGGAGSYYAAHPGVPSADIANEFLGSPGGALRGLLGSTVPMARIPYEVATATNVGTGAPIKDKTDYIDQNVPGLNTVSSLLNRSASSGFTQSTRSVQTGNETGGPDGLAFLNWLTGGGAQDISRRNYIKEAQFERRGR